MFGDPDLEPVIPQIVRGHGFAGADPDGTAASGNGGCRSPDAAAGQQTDQFFSRVPGTGGRIIGKVQCYALVQMQTRHEKLLCNLSFSCGRERRIPSPDGEFFPLI